MIDRYVVASRFAMKTFETAGFPMGKFRLKPNFLLDDPGAGDQRLPRALFAGRLTREKGVDLLLEAWRRIPPDKDLKLVFAGDGELRAAVEKAAHLDDRISLLGQIERQELFSQMKQASFLVCPFRSYETFGNVAVEALACGLPVLAPDRGALPEVVASKQEGILFEPDSVSDLARKLMEMTRFATPASTRAARRSYELRFTPLIAYERTMEIYEQLVEGRKADG